MYRINLNVEINRYGRWWDKNSEIDIVGIGEIDIIFGECKWSNKKVGINILEELVKKSENVEIKGKNRSYILFSKSGFTEELMKSSEDRKDIYLIDLEKIDILLKENHSVQISSTRRQEMADLSCARVPTLAMLLHPRIMSRCQTSR